MDIKETKMEVWGLVDRLEDHLEVIYYSCTLLSTKWVHRTEPYNHDKTGLYVSIIGSAVEEEYRNK